MGSGLAFLQRVVHISPNRHPFLRAADLISLTAATAGPATPSKPADLAPGKYDHLTPAWSSHERCRDSNSNHGGSKVTRTRPKRGLPLPLSPIVTRSQSVLMDSTTGAPAAAVKLSKAELNCGV